MTGSAREESFDLQLMGCRPEPLASYLKALGVLRLVAEQKDPEARGFWRGEHFVLRSVLDRAALTRFFIEEWRPTPVVAPWNGGSGFYPKDNRKAGNTIVASQEPRLSGFAASIEIARSFVATRGWTERPADEDKMLLLSTMRARLPDEAIAWLDAAVVLGSDRLLFPPLLGTGGNDGRLDFSNNFQQRVVEVLASSTNAAVESSMFGTATTNRFEGAMGQYQPAASERTNPWDFVLLIEGALMFAAAATRRYENASPTTMAFPFHARAAGGLSTVTESDESESRDELWLPLWSSPATTRELRRLFAEGRATVGTGDSAHAASSALDFARAVTALGVDRGIDSFARVAFLPRNGLAYFATPLGRFATREVGAARLLDDIDVWFNRLRRKASGKNVPGRIALASRRLEQAMFDAASTGKLEPVLLELGEAEQALAHSLPFAAKAHLGPLPPLPSAWKRAVDARTIEQRLAASLAARAGMRGRLLPLDESGRNFGRGDEANRVFSERPLVDNLHALLLREDVEAQQQERRAPKEATRKRCSLTDVAHFIDGSVDDVLVERWLRAFLLLGDAVAPEVPDESVRPPASFALLSLVHHRSFRDVELPRTANVLALACTGDAIGATAPAIRRLGAAAYALPVKALVEPIFRMRRIAAALAFPLSLAQRRTLESMVLPAADQSANNDTSTGSQDQT